jgi:hypothetical protein
LGPNKEEQSWKLDRFLMKKITKENAKKAELFLQKKPISRAFMGKKWQKMKKSSLAGTIKGGNGDAKEEG